MFSLMGVIFQLSRKLAKAENGILLANFAEDRHSRLLDERGRLEKKLADQFGYQFNAEGQLRRVSDGGEFVYDVKPNDREFNQKSYEELGDLLTDYVYNLMETECKLKRTSIPLETETEEPKSFVFHSQDLYTNPDKLMILIHGSGAVRAGQWARRLIVNRSLESGTQLPYIKRAIAEGYAVLVLNPNLNNYVDSQSGRSRQFPQSGSPIAHSTYVWRHLVAKSPASRIAIVAHSYGGVITLSLAQSEAKSFESRVFGVAFTDSVHTPSGVNGSTKDHLYRITRNWVTSEKPLGEHISDAGYDVQLVSAGTTAHDQTSWKSIELIFKFFQEKYNDWGKGQLKSEL